MENVVEKNTKIKDDFFNDLNFYTWRKYYAMSGM